MKNFDERKLLFLALFCVYGTVWGDRKNYREESRWDWDSIDTEQVSFSPGFMWGAAVSGYQTEGAASCSNSNWSNFEKKMNYEPSGNACDSWNNRAQDIECFDCLLPQTKPGQKRAFRFSVEWCKVEPEPGRFDMAVIQHYKDFCLQLLKNGIEPFVTLHHFVHPQWFEDMGAFEKKENLRYFVRFCEIMFHVLHEHVFFWCTINEPNIYAFQGYARGVFPPGQSGMSGMRMMGTVLENMLDAHVQVYDALKKIEQNSCIGLVHQYLTFEPFHATCESRVLVGSVMTALLASTKCIELYTDKSTACASFLIGACIASMPSLNIFKSPMKSLIETMITTILTSMLNESVINYFKNEKYKFFVPPLVMKQSDKKGAGDKLDFIGLNYYSHVRLRLYHRLKDPIHPGYREGEIETDMPYGIYAEGLYRAIVHISELKKPIYITENGISDRRDDRRETWLRRYLYALSEAIRDGYDVRGYFYWSLLDNYEWDMGYAQKFGLYAVDFNDPKKRRTLRKGAEWLRTVVTKN